MARVKVYVRIAPNRGGRDPYKIEASAAPNYAPLRSAAGRVLPTAAFAVALEIPDAAFRRAEQVLAEIELTADVVRVAAEVAP